MLTQSLLLRLSAVRPNPLSTGREDIPVTNPDAKSPGTRHKVNYLRRIVSSTQGFPLTRKFKPEYERQMLLYLRYLNKNSEESPIGLILCTEGNTEHIEYLMFEEDSPIKVAQYYT